MSAPRVVVSPHNVVGFPQGGGHLWAYLQHVQGLRGLGCEVWWMECLLPKRDASRDRDHIALLRDRLSAYGMGDRVLFYELGADGEPRWVHPWRAAAERILRDADLLLNFHYRMSAPMLARFRRTALVDIDPGLLQLWLHRREVVAEPHDVYFTTGETVGLPGSSIPDCGLPWVRIRPAVSLADWPWAGERTRDAFTTVSSWWGGEWIADDDGNWLDNNKRASFLEFVDLPKLVGAPLELALNTGPKDADDLRLLADRGWTVRHIADVVATPGDYRRYIRTSRGEISCAKPSCMRFQGAWMSDRTLCYLAGGRPAVVQHTGPSPALDGRDGLVRFTTLEEAAAGIDDVAARYDEHRLAARTLAEDFFDARKVAAQMLDQALGDQRRAAA